MDLLNCDYCDVKFLPNQYKWRSHCLNIPVFCSADCRRKKKKADLTRECEFCEKSFVLNDYQKQSETVDPNFKLFCSKECKADNFRGVECEWCAKRFIATSMSISYKKKKPDYKFVCSKKCRRRISRKHDVYNAKELHPDSLVNTKLDMIKQDHIDGLTLRDIGKRYGVSGERIRQVLNREGIDTSWASKPNKVFKCAWCSKEHEARTQYCSRDCQKKARYARNGPPTSELYDWLECHRCKNWFLRTVQRSRIHMAMARSNGREPVHVYCTKECYSKALSQHPIGGNNSEG